MSSVRSSATDHSAGSRRTVRTATLEGSRVALSVSVLSRAATPKSAPLYHDEDTIHGNVQVNLDKKRGVSSIVLSVYGRHSCAGHAESTVFLELHETIWTPATKKAAREGLGERDLRGQYNWDFAILLPRCCNKAFDSNVLLPPTFGGSSIPETLAYEIRCTVKRGRFAEDETLLIPMQYRPQTVAGRGAPSRLQAYHNATPIPGPEIDPNAWRSFQMTYRGDFFSRRMVTIDCEFSLAAPLAFARGDPIPVAVQLSSDDQQILDLFDASPNALNISLHRTLSCQSASAGTWEETVGHGQYWTSSRAPSTLRFSGEIDASAHLLPSFYFGKLSISYAIRFNLSAPGLQFDPACTMDAIPVRICTIRAHGPKPVSYAKGMNSKEARSDEHPASPVSPTSPWSALLSVYSSAGDFSRTG